MSNNLQIFKNNDFGEIRVIELNGEPWFVGKDVADKLGYSNISDALIKRKGEDYNTPTQKSVDLGVIEIKEGTRVHPDGHTSITKTPKITGKGQIYFINKFKKNNQISMLG